jgi:hypothetical protein
MGIDAFYVASRDSGEHGLRPAARHKFRIVNSFADTGYRLIDIHHHSSAQTFGGSSAETDDIYQTLTVHLADYGANFSGSDIQADNGVLAS